MSQENVEIVRERNERLVATGEVEDDWFEPDYVWDMSTFTGSENPPSNSQKPITGFRQRGNQGRLLATPLTAGSCSFAWQIEKARRLHFAFWETCSSPPRRAPFRLTRPSGADRFAQNRRRRGGD